MVSTQVTKARVKATAHPATGMTSFDVVVRVQEARGNYIESIHLDERDAQQRADAIIGQEVDFLDLVRTTSP